jgi:hypothetical protein
MEAEGTVNEACLVKGRRNTLEDAKVGQRGGTASALVRQHATDSLVEHARRSTVVEGSANRVGVHTLVEVSLVLQAVTEERTSDVQLLATDSHNMGAFIDSERGTPNETKTYQREAPWQP